MKPRPLTLLFIWILLFGSNAHAASLKDVAGRLDMMLCQGAENYQASLGASAPLLEITAVNDFPFSVQLMFAEGTGWKTSQAAAGEAIELSLQDGSVLLVADTSIEMCVGGLIIKEGGVSGALSLASSVTDFNGNDLVAVKPTKKGSAASVALDCPDSLTGGVIWTDLGIAADKADLSSIDLEACLNQIPDGAKIPLFGDPSVVTRSQDNMASTVNFRKAVKATEFCNLMSEKEANKFEEQLKLEGVRQGLIIVLAERSIADGQSYWIKGRDEQWDDYMKLHLETSYKMEELMQEFWPIMEKPEANGPCMCKQLNLAC